MSNNSSPQTTALPRLRDPIWQFLSVTVAIAAILISLFSSYDIYKKATPLKGLDIQIVYSSPIVSIAANANSKIELLYDGENIECASLLGIYFENAGNTAILPTDFVSPLEIGLPESAQIVTTTIRNTRPQNLTPTFNQPLPSKVVFEPLLLNPQDAFTMELTIINLCETENIPISVNGRIIGVRDLTITPLTSGKSFLDRIKLAYNTEAMIIIPIVTLVVFVLLWFWSRIWDVIEFIFGNRPNTLWGRISLNLAIATLIATVAEDVVEGLVQLLK